MWHFPACVRRNRRTSCAIPRPSALLTVLATSMLAMGTLASGCKDSAQEEPGVPTDSGHSNTQNPAVSVPDNAADGAHPATTASQATDTAAADSQPHTTADGIPLEGMFRYMAGNPAETPQFRDCRTGKSYPVAMVGPYIELESAYLSAIQSAGAAPGEERKVALHGRFMERPAMEGKYYEIMLIVNYFDKLLDSNDCTPLVHADLFETYWKLVELGGKKVTPRADGRDQYLVLNREENRVNGFAGCNHFFGQFVAGQGDALVFSALGATRMACHQGADTEQAFVQVLERSNRAVISGLFLELYFHQRLLARFEAVYLP